MKPKNTVVLVIIAHVGLFLAWMCMGGCSINRDKGDVEVISPEDIMIPEPGGQKVGMNTSEIVREEPVVRERTIDTGAVRKPIRDLTHDPDKEMKYVVKSGDSIWKISRKFGVKEADLIERNDIRDASMIRVGRELYIPVKGGVSITEKPVVEEKIEEEVKSNTEISAEIDEEAETETIPDEETETGTVVEGPESTEPEYTYHTVQEGDTIWKLARTYGVTTDEIMQLNQIKDPKKIQVGQKLKILKK